DAGSNNVYDVVVSASDGTFTDTSALAVRVFNVNEGVTITSNGGGAGAAIAVAENGTGVTTVAAVDADGGAVTYAIAGGADSARFTIDASTGALAFVTAPDFEAPSDADGDNVYDVIVSAGDGSFTDSQALAVTVGNVDEGVTINSNGGGASATVAVAENGTAVLTVSASDADGGPVTYAIAGGADAARFRIDAATGALVFVSAPDFELPADAGGDNVYDVVVSASDGAFTATQAIAVQVGNVNEAPVITSNGGGSGAFLTVAENGTAVTLVRAVDPDETAATYSIVGGADAARFTIDPQTGALQFIAAPDFEMPADADGDNVYAVIVRAGDGQYWDEQVLSVSVTNVRDGNNVTGTSGNDSISGSSLNLALRTSNEEDIVYGRDGHDNIHGMAGDDDLYGEGGNDTLVGGAGADRLFGGLGKDQFTYNAVSDSTASAPDLILDFSRAQGDRISLSAIDANSLVSSNQAFTFIGSAAFSNVAGQLRYETSGGMTTVYGDVNGDGVADLQIQLSGTIALVASDFIL
ncbi:MAG TPA: cadherin, partial [Allosphingosinicella sp.]|nr:cadherin [Allosphingosinicella sp.]